MNTIDYGNTVRIEYAAPRPSLGDIYAIYYFSIGAIAGTSEEEIERERGGNEWGNLANWFPLDCLIAILSACLSLRMLDTRHGVDMGTPFLAPSRELSIRTLYLYANRTRNALIIQFCNCCRRCQRFAFELHAEFISIINAVGGILSYYYTKGRKREREWNGEWLLPSVQRSMKVPAEVDQPSASASDSLQHEGKRRKGGLTQ